MRAVKSRAIFVVALLSAITLVGCGKAANTANPTEQETVGNTTGVTDTEIKIGTLLPLSNTAAAAWGVTVKAGMQAYFDYINREQGGINGRKITLIVCDNQYSGPVSSECARKLVEQDGVFAILGSLGSEAHRAIWNYLDEKGVPDMFFLTGESELVKPPSRNHFGMLVDYITEGRILGKYIAENYSSGKLGILAQNDDFGKEGVEGIKLGLEENNNQMDVVVEYYDSIQNDVTAQTQRLRNADVDIVALYALPLQAGSFFHTSREVLNWKVPVVTSGVDAAEVVATLAGFDNIEGAVAPIIGYPAYRMDQSGVIEYRDILDRYAPGTSKDTTTIIGLTISELLTKIVQQAGPNLTREGLIKSAEALCPYQCLACIDPVKMASNDHSPFEIETYARATVDRSTNPPSFRWEIFGEPFGFEATSSCQQK